MSSLQEQLLKKIMAAKTQFVSDLKDKEPVRASFLIKYSAVAQGKNGKPYMNLVLMDKSGEVEAAGFLTMPLLMPTMLCVMPLFSLRASASSTKAENKSMSRGTARGRSADR